MSDLISTLDDERVQAIRERLAKAFTGVARRRTYLAADGEVRCAAGILATDLDLVLAAARENDALREQLVAVREDLEQSICDRLREEDEAAATEAELSTARAALSEARALLPAPMVIRYSDPPLVRQAVRDNYAASCVKYVESMRASAPSGESQPNE